MTDLELGEVTGRTYVVTANYGDRVTAVCSADLTNPPEWALVRAPQPNDSDSLTVS